MRIRRKKEQRVKRGLLVLAGLGFVGCAAAMCKGKMHGACERCGHARCRCGQKGSPSGEKIDAEPAGVV